MGHKTRPDASPAFCSCCCYWCLCWWLLLLLLAWLLPLPCLSSSVKCHAEPSLTLFCLSCFSSPLPSNPLPPSTAIVLHSLNFFHCLPPFSVFYFQLFPLSCLFASLPCPLDCWHLSFFYNDSNIFLLSLESVYLPFLFFIFFLYLPFHFPFFLQRFLLIYFGTIVFKEYYSLSFPFLTVFSCPPSLFLIILTLLSDICSPFVYYSMTHYCVGECCDGSTVWRWIFTR